MTETHLWAGPTLPRHGFRSRRLQMSTPETRVRQALSRGKVPCKYVPSLSCFQPVSEKRMTFWVQQWARLRRSGHCVHRPVLTSQLRILRERNGIGTALDFRDRLLRIGAYPTGTSFWKPGKPGPDFWQIRLYVTRKLDSRHRRNTFQFWVKRALAGEGIR